MGRGKRQTGGVLSTASVLGIKTEPRKASDSINKNINKNLGKRQEFMQDRTAWRKAEKARIQEILSELEKATKEFASSNESWKKFLAEYAEAPSYSVTNMIWARAQLRTKGVEATGDIFSESVWKRLGRRPKAEFARNLTRAEKKRDSRYGFDSDREWSDKYCAEMLAPMMIQVEKKDPKTGKPLLDGNGKKIKIPIPMKNDAGEIIYRSFIGYHADATESIDEQDTPLPHSPWTEATGSSEDAEALLKDLKTKVMKGQGLELKEGNNEGNQVAELSSDNKTIVLDSSAPAQEQANALLGKICQSVALRSERKKNEELEGYTQRQDLAITSAQYVLASLYKINNEKQTFPHLYALKDDSKSLKKVNSAVHHIVGNILVDFDPLTRAKKMNHS